MRVSQHPKPAVPGVKIAIVACAIVLCALASLFVLWRGTNAAYVYALIVAAVPLGLVAIGRRPLRALLAAYVLAVPFDSISDILPFGTVTKLLGALVAVAAILAMLERRSRVRIPYAVFGWLLVVSLMALSLLWAIDPAESSRELGTMLLNFGLFALLALVPIEADEVQWMLVATVASGAIAGIVAVVMTMHGTDFSGGRLFLAAGKSVTDPNGFAASLLLPVALAAAHALRYRDWRALPFAGALVLGIAAMYFAASRGAFIALVAMGLIGALHSGRRLRLFLVGLVVACTTAVLFTPNAIALRFFAQSRALSGAGRTSIWKVGLETFKSHWLFGRGFASFPSAYDQAFFSAYEPQFESWHRAPHNLLVSTSTELGVIGLVVLGIALALQYRAVAKPASKDNWMLLPLRVAFVGLLVASLFIDVLTRKYAWLVFMEMLLVARLYHPAGAQRPVQAQRHG